MSQIIDSYSESNQSSWSSNIMQGQSFTGDGGVLNSAKFYLERQGSPAGNTVVEIYAHSGTFGTSSVPTGDPLATSDSIASSSISLDPILVTFTFTGADKITLVNGTKYVVIVKFDNTGSPDYIWVGIDTSSPTHAGNICWYTGTEWQYTASNDCCFYVYKDESSASPSPSVSLSATPSTSESASISPTPTGSPTPSVSISLSPSSSLSLSASLSASLSPSSSLSASPSLSVSPSPSPHPPFFGLKIAKSGFNVLEETDPNKLIFSSEYNTLKYYKGGTITHSVSEADNTLYRTKSYYTHDLNFYPYFEVYCKDNLMSGWQPVGKFEAGAGSYRSFYAYVTKTKLYVVASGYTGIGGAGETYDVVFYYKIFRNNLGL